LGIETDNAFKMVINICNVNLYTVYAVNAHNQTPYLSSPTFLNLYNMLRLYIVVLTY